MALLLVPLEPLAHRREREPLTTDLGKVPPGAKMLVRGDAIGSGGGVPGHAHVRSVEGYVPRSAARVHRWIDR